MIPNLRDLGGIRTRDGRTVRHGMLIRSAQLSQANEQDLRGVAAVIDLRTPEERSEAPDKTYGRQYLPRPIFEELTSGISHEKIADDQGIPDMTMLYRLVVTRFAASFREVMLTIMQHDFTGGAILWHCTEGKDRCGLTTALILEILGADRETIIADYLKTNEINLPKAIKIRHQLAKERGEAFAESVYQAYIADVRYLSAAWDAMGGSYIRDRLGITDEMIRAFRDTVLE